MGEAEGFLVGHCGIGYPDVYYVTYREYALRHRAFIENRSFESAQTRRLVYYMIANNAYLKSQYKPKKETDLWRLVGDEPEAVASKPSQMSSQMADLLRASGLKVADRNIKKDN